MTEKGCHPILVRLAWHDAGTYDVVSKTGGPRAAMRHAEGESKHASNTGYVRITITLGTNVYIFRPALEPSANPKELSGASRTRMEFHGPLTSP
jgi:L-ascorbate peroxidase